MTTKTKAAKTRPSTDTKVKIPSVEELFKVGAHFGHRREHSDARFKNFVFLTQNKVNIIDLEKTREGLKKALAFLAQKAQQGARFLFVGTKPQAKKVVEKLGKELGQAYVTERWLGGTLTNFETIKKSLEKIENLENYVQSEEFKKLTKREKNKVREKLAKLHRTFDGLLPLESLPDVLVVFGAHQEEIAVLEARERGVATVGICDSDFNPQLLDYPIPANDDSLKTVELIGELIYQTLKKNLPSSPEKSVKKKEE